MNGKKAKALRRQAGFVPAAPRTYRDETNQFRDANGNVKMFPGTRTAQGARKVYQSLKVAV